MELKAIQNGAQNVFGVRRASNRHRYTAIEKATTALDSKKITALEFLNCVTFNVNSSVGNNDDSSDEEQINETNPRKKRKIASPLCAICDERPFDTVMLPCKHANICKSCYNNIVQVAVAQHKKTLCPYCRTEVKETINIYIN